MSTRRSKSVTNVEVDVELISTQNECIDDSRATMNKKQNSTKTSENILEVTCTPKREPQTVLQDLKQTPRRSCRRSVKPAQDYDDIVKRSLRSCTRSARKALLDDEENNENHENVIAQPKWTPAEVGRVSQKRSRKSKRVEKGKSQNKNTETMAEDISGCKKDENVEKKHVLENTAVSGKKDSLQPSEEQIVDASVNHERLLKQEINEHRDSGVNNEPNFEDICIIYENNICIDNDNDTQSKSPKSIASVDKADSFGCYLKSKDIYISDLGLNPISHEDDKDDENLTNLVKELPKEVEEMPSLIICDDDDDDVDSKQFRTLNETFEAQENVKTENCKTQNEEIMEILQVSDDCETPKKCPRIVLTDASAQNHTLLLSAKKESAVKTQTSSTSKTLKRKLPTTPKPLTNASAIKAKLPSTPKTTTSKFLSTPQQSKKQYRVPTPYRSRNFKFDDETKEVLQKTPNKCFPKSSVISLTTLEPREIILRGIRKRSLSVCNSAQQRKNLLAEPLGKQKQARVVSFHSPANQTTIIDDLDMIIAQSVKKQKVPVKDSLKKFVTTRRKRSLSLDESFMISSINSKLPRPVIKNLPNNTKSPTTSKSLKRTKLPNFAAIHEKQFNKMENLVDHVSRKQERSKNLINSASKLMSASAQKHISLNKNNIKKTAEKPRALKKIDLNLNAQKSEKPDLKKKSPMQKKPAFNLSTSINAKNTAFASNFAEKTNTSRLYNDKMESRLQRHMDLFKGRSASTRTGLTSSKNEVILKGVRSNRRFELQMQHRKNLGQ